MGRAELIIPTSLGYNPAMPTRHRMSEPDATVHNRRLLFESLGVSLVDFRCRAHVEPEGPEEPNPTHSIVLVRRGVFVRTGPGETLVADPNQVLFFNARESYRFSHPLPGGDDCTILVLETHRALEVVGHYASRDAEDPERPFRLGHGLSSPRVARLHYEVLALSRRQVMALALEDALCELVEAAVKATYREHGEPLPPQGRHPGAMRRRREMVEATKLTINQRVASPARLADLARDLGCSPFQLSRTFRQITGVTLRRYALRLRARLAADRLVAGARNLTQLALDLGYVDHSHFTNVFRGEWSVTPSRFRERAAGPPLAR
jgi:AraC-like DNA-binding protein